MLLLRIMVKPKSLRKLTGDLEELINQIGKANGPATVKETVESALFRYQKRQDVVANSGGSIQDEPQLKLGDRYPSGNGAYKTQQQLFNHLRKLMISAADIYRIGKSAPNEVLERLRNGFDNSWLITRTSINYSGDDDLSGIDDDLRGIITQNCGSTVVKLSKIDVTVVKPSKIDVLVIPVYDNTPLDKALQTPDGLRYIQFLFDTNDDPETITKTLKKLSGKEAKDIRLSTPDIDSRGKYAERPVGFRYHDGLFHVDGNLLFGGSGHSYAVSVVPRNGLAKK